MEERLWSFVCSTVVVCGLEKELGRVSNRCRVYDLKKRLVVCRPEKELGRMFDRGRVYNDLTGGPHIIFVLNSNE